jgi:DNA-binding transcriptional regulator YiaG
MPNIVDLVKTQILRLARKEAKAEIGKARKVTAKYRREVAQLKRLLHQVERELRHLRKQQQVPTEEEPSIGLRYSARSVRSQRQRLGLSAKDYARLVGVTPLTILSWEQGRSRPRKAQFARLVTLRGIGKEAAMTKLAELELRVKKRR